MQDFEGLNIFVSGSTSGIGKSIAECFAKRGAKRVFINGRNEAKALKALEEFKTTCPNTLFPLFIADVSDEEECSRLFRKMEEILGEEPLHIGINNAGVVGYSGKLHTLPQNLNFSFGKDSPFDPMSNYYGTRNCMKEEIQLWLQKKHPEGIIVNITSASGLIGCPGNAAYAASKSAVIGLTKSVALEYGKLSEDTEKLFSARINCVAPGAVNTPLLRNQMKLPQQSWEGPDIDTEHPLFQKFCKHAVPTLPNGKIATPDEVAQVVLFLCLPASSYINGAVISVDGGIAAGWTGT